MEAVLKQSFGTASIVKPGIAAHDKRIQLPAAGLLPLNRQKNAAAGKAQGIGAEFPGISRREIPGNWSG
jgi:hypothetical protein